MKNEEVVVNKMNSVNMFRFIKQVLRPYYHAFVRMMKWRRRIGRKHSVNHVANFVN